MNKGQISLSLFCIRIIVVPASFVSRSVMSDSCDALNSSPPGSSVEFSRQEYWSGVPFPSPRGSSISRDQTQVSHIAGGFFTSEPPGREDSLEKEMATHSSILAWGIPWTEEPDRLQYMGF